MPTIKQKTINLLRWSEKYTKTDMVYFAHNGFWVLLSQFIISAAAFIVTLALANTLTKETFGQYRFITTVIPILALFTLSSLGAALTRSIARGYTINWRKIILTKIYYGLSAMLLSVLIAGYYFTKGNILLVQIYLIIAVFIPFHNVFLLYNNYLQGVKNFKHASKYVSMTRIFQLTLLVAVALLTQNILYIIISFFVGLLLPQYLFYKRTHLLHLVPVQNKKTEPRIIHYALWFTALQSLGAVAGNLDKIFTWHYLGSSQFAIYAIGLTLPLNILLLFNFIPQIYFPAISTLTLTVQTRIKIIKKIFLMLLLLISIAAAYALISPWLLPALFGTYTDSVSITIILAALIPLLPANSLILKIFQAHNLFRQIIIIRLLTLGIFPIVFFSLYAEHPLLAAAYAFVVGECIALIVSLLFLRYARLSN